jgi:ABC-type dipeptide/oligopeptide/nickel transport system permease component
MKSYFNFLIGLFQRIFWLLVMGLAIIYFGYLGLDMMTIRDIRGAKLDRFGLNLMNVREMRSTRLNMGEIMTEAANKSFNYLQMISEGELGTVILVKQEEKVLDVLKTSIKNSLGLLGISLALATLLGTWLGGMAALRRRSEGAYGMLTFTMLGVSLPAFLVAVLLQRAGIWYTTTYGTQLVKMGGYGWTYKTLLMPVLVLMARPLAHITRLVYITMIEIMKTDYIRTAYAKGVYKRRVVWLHAGLNLATSLVTAVGVSLRYSLGILPLVEFIFAWPGLGLYALAAIRKRLPPLLIAIALIFGLAIQLLNMLIKYLNRSIDPTLREATQ